MQVNVGSRLSLKGVPWIVLQVLKRHEERVTRASSRFFEEQVVAARRAGAAVLESKIDNFPVGAIIDFEQECITLVPVNIEQAGAIQKLIYTKYNVRRVNNDEQRNQRDAAHSQPAAL